MIVLLVLFLSLIIPAQFPVASAGSINPVIKLDTVTVYTNTIVEFPIYYQQLDTLAVTSYQLTIRYNPLYREFDSASTLNTITEQALLQYNQPSAGLIQIAVAGTFPLPDSGTLLHIYFRSLDRAGLADIHLDRYVLNEQEPSFHASQGLIHVVPQPVFYLPQDTVHISSGREFDLSIYLSSEQEIVYSGSFQLQYDPSYFSLDGLSADSTQLSALDALVSYTIDEPGYADILFASGYLVEAGTPPLFKALFKSIGERGISEIYLTNMAVNENSMSSRTEKGIVSIEPPFMWGDTNSDTYLTVDDAVFVLGHLLSLFQLEDQALLAADVSANNYVTAFDAALILQHVYGIISCFPADTSCHGDKFDHYSHHPDAPVAFPLMLEPPHRSSTLYTLTLGNSTHATELYAIELSIRLNTAMRLQEEILSFLPPDWLIMSHQSGKKIHLTLAGSSALSPGKIVALPTPFQIESLSVNDGIPVVQTEHSAEREHATPPEITRIYPNPFNNLTQVNYTTQEAGDVEVILFDILGRPIQRLVKEYVSAGTHQLVIKGSQIASGTYFLRIKAPDGASIESKLIKR